MVVRSLRASGDGRARTTRHNRKWTAGDPRQRIARLNNSNPNPSRKAIAMQKVPQTQEPSTWSIGILVGLGRRGKHVYGGTVPASVVADRRRRNKQARASRRINRGQR